MAVGTDVAGAARETLDFPDDLLLPGLVDLHTHPAPADWKFGIDADRFMLARGSTTVLSQGDAGAVTWPQYQAEIIAPAQTAHPGWRSTSRASASPAPAHAFSAPTTWTWTPAWQR